MECVASIMEVASCLWHFTYRRILYIRNLKKNLFHLEKAMDQLKQVNQDVMARVEREEEQQMKRTNQVDGWLRSVMTLEEEVRAILRQGAEEEQKRCLGGFCPKNCRSCYRVGKRAVRMLNEVNKLMAERHFDAVVERAVPGAMDERPMDMTVGLGMMLEKVWRCIKDPSVGTIGLYGMGGVGKTTLLKKINNEFRCRDHDFELVIWVVVSRQADVGKVQKVIWNKLGIADHLWRNKNEEERAVDIFRILRMKRFVLLLDDVWERFDTCKVGVPLPDGENKSKVVFTTRSEDVCGQMEAHRRFRVKCLTNEEAMDLFKTKVGADTLNSHPDIPRLATVVAEECKGLPLALITVGRAMVCRKNPQEWEHAVEALRSYPSKFSGMVDYVYLLLEFSFESLRDTTLQSCFLYCSMFPEDYNIKKNDLIDLWIGEGFLDPFGDTHEARNRGEYIIGSLKLACLLEGDETNQEYVRMHDVVRDMALWLACERSEKSKILVHQRGRLCESYRASKWKEAARISLWGRNISNLPSAPASDNAVTMLARETRLKTLPHGFFELLSDLKVLDMSCNHELIELPASIGALTKLQHLNLSETAIRELPVELMICSQLRFLLLNSTDHLTNIPRGLISNLPLLQVFSKLPNQLDLSLGQCHDERALLEELEGLEHLDDLCFSTSNAHCLQMLLNSDRLKGCIRNLCIVKCSDLTVLQVSSSSVSKMKHLQRLAIYHCDSLTELKIASNFGVHGENFRNLRHLSVGACPLSNMTWIVYAPGLQTLTLVDCASMEEVVAADEHLGSGQNPFAFSCLTTLELIRLPKLKGIYPRSLPFPSLTQVRVHRCQNLLRLPFDSNSAKKSLRRIVGERSWWGTLHWENEAIKHAFSSKFVPM